MLLTLSRLPKYTPKGGIIYRDGKGENPNVFAYFWGIEK